MPVEETTSRTVLGRALKEAGTDNKKCVELIL